MLLAELRGKIENKQAVLGVIGLGYVGLPVAAAFARAGFRVIGGDIRAERVALINAGRSPIEGDEPGLAELLAEVTAAGRLRATTDYNELKPADAVLINVETPVDDDHRPRYAALKAACRALGPVLKDGALVIVESTIAPGTIDTIVRPLLEECTGRVTNDGFYLGACPERVMPGRLLSHLRAMSRVCGGSTPETAETMVALYRHVVEAELDVADPVTTELVKTAENAYRDVQIAFANEVALICEVVGADVWRVRELVNKVPSRHMHLPGAGVGGHCIPKDPWLLAHGAAGKAPVRLIPQARLVNDSMPMHVADLTLAALQAAGVNPGQARVLVLGYAYLENSDDSRNSPSQALVAQLGGRVQEVRIHDPWVPGYQGELLTLAAGCDAAVVMVAHQAYRQLHLPELKAMLRTPVLIDGRHVFERSQAEAAGLLYRCVGQGNNRA
ncbi:MAG: nucleotide sugar dehydrogenase [Chloroflexi bacterium]|nr:nucleotide sugar dehydrogenase [Chloroflexota bacterium]MCI0645243.1 nucleotide sugar dehydrogenase [Chloroflexota bacterium]MCI0725315.1 nucleotide sugar dehydrogenase [Chloroflexota bacterium]